MKNKTTISKTQVAKILARFEPAHARRLRQLHNLWKNPAGGKSLSRWQVGELRAAGLIRTENGTGASGEVTPDNVPQYCNGSELARILSAEFNTHVSSVQISRALRNDAMAGKQSNGTWKTSEAISWWEQHRVSRGQRAAELAAQADEADCQRRISDSRRAALELENCQKASSDKFVLRTVAEATLISVLRRHHFFVKNAFERTLKISLLEKLRDKLAPEQLAIVADACVAVGREIISAVETDCEKACSQAANPSTT